MDPLPVAYLELPTADETHLWQLYLPEAQKLNHVWWSWLSEDERARAQRFLRTVDRERFVLSRGGLRYLLARYLQCEPSSLAFAYSAYGKPSLLDANPPLHFNLAHSGNWVIYGCSLCQWTGVDVEEISSRAYLEALIQRCLTAAEQTTLPQDLTARLTRFLQYWTVKEAHLKAVGLGLSYPMTQVQVVLEPTPYLEHPAMTEVGTIADWFTQLWNPGPGAIAALCVGQSQPHIRMRQLLESLPQFPVGSDNRS